MKETLVNFWSRASKTWKQMQLVSHVKRSFLFLRNVTVALYRSGYSKLLISALLVFLAGLMLAIHTNVPMALVCAGMGFSFFGDAMLMQYPPIRNMVRQYFLWGTGCFAAAQVLYLRAMWMLYVQASGSALWPLRWMIILFVMTALALMCKLILFRPRQPMVLRIMVTLYAILVATMAGSAVAVCFATAGRGWALLIGGPLFMLSDLLIALNDFGGVPIEHKDAWVWSTYVPAQLLLILGTAALV